MGILDFLQKKKDNTNKKVYDEFQNLIKPPKTDTENEIPHIKNNISRPNYLHQADLIFMPSDRFGLKYCLVVIDVYDSKCDAEPLRTKTSQAVKTALTKIYNRDYLDFPTVIQFDAGTEFKAEVKEFMEQKHVSVKYTLTNRHRQNSTVERKNRTIGSALLSYQAEMEQITGKQNKQWVSELPQLIKFLNEHKLAKRPKLTGDVQTNPKNENILEVGTPVRRVLDYAIDTVEGKRMGTGAFRSGDLRWDKEIRKIVKIIINPNMPPMYQLNKVGTENELDNSVAYTFNQLQKVIEDEVKIVKVEPKKKR